MFGGEININVSIWTCLWVPGCALRIVRLLPPHVTPSSTSDLESVSLHRAPSTYPLAPLATRPLIHRPLSIVSNGRRHTLTSPLIPKSALPLAPPPRSDTTAARPATALQKHRCQADPQLGQARPAHRGSCDHTPVQPIAGKGFRLFITTHQHPLLGPHQTKH
jgi:hypothetical protein